MLSTVADNCSADLNNSLKSESLMMTNLYTFMFLMFLPRFLIDL
ncbi:GSCOCG00010637001-RA-CDS [Cotesia congregata]|nr:GSCOCG00010637001-RA-CDS [Cotesia congregata]